MKKSKAPKIKVTIRKRPLSKKEDAKGEKDIITVEDRIITIAEDREKLDLTKYVEMHKYKFDRVYDENVTTEQVP